MLVGVWRLVNKEDICTLLDYEHLTKERIAHATFESLFGSNQRRRHQLCRFQFPKQKISILENGGWRAKVSILVPALIRRRWPWPT
jgi:hypothetical protein